jgi:hypothetical protein
MTPPTGGFTPRISQVRNRVEERLDRQYDSCLVNFYSDGKTGMRFHSDPDQACGVLVLAHSPRCDGRAHMETKHACAPHTASTHETKHACTPHTASYAPQGTLWGYSTTVVSVGDTRTFVFRDLADKERRATFALRHGDVVEMWGDCQQLYQHSIKVEAEADRARPRMSLVYKRTLASERARRKVERAEWSSTK